VNHLICGYDYTFGKNALGNYQTLLAYQNNHYQVELCKPILNASGMKISSTLIKSLITKGEVKQANSYLMEDFSLSGEVIHGNHLGFQIGFATANVRLDEQYISPRNGVYGGLVKYQDHLYLAMINVGVHPTINQLDTSLLEAHLIDENITLYGETITIYFKTFIREEIKFTSLKALKEELEANKKTIQALSKQENWENC
jgi:riboflavin kinase/FMN adenylyltransferase